MPSNLIYAMSTSSNIKLEQFNEIFRQVYLPYGGQKDEQIDVDARQQVIRVLDSLAYCEFDFDNRMVYMCKPSLVLLPEFGLPKALLVGARTPQLEKKLKALVKERRRKAILTHLQYSRNDTASPNSLCIQAIDRTIIQEIADKADIDCDITTPAAWRLADMSATLDEIKGKLNFERRVEPSWNKRVFITERLMFSRYIAKNPNECLVEYRHPVTKQLYHWIWNDDNTAEVSRDWGRYIVLANYGCRILIFDEKQFKIAVPVTVPLPCLLGRATALCSGIPPSIVTSYKQKVGEIPPEHPLQVYSCVTPDIAQLIAGKLNQKLLYASLAVDKEGGLHA